MEPGPAIVRWQLRCGSVMTLVDTGKLFVLEDVNVHLEGIHPSVVGVHIHTDEKVSCKSRGKAFAVVVHYCIA